MKNLYSLLFISLFIFSCHDLTDTQELSLWVKQSIIQEWEKEIAGEYEIIDFNLVHQAGKEYKGLLSVIDYSNNERFSYIVKVIYDGDSFIWEIPELIY